MTSGVIRMLTTFATCSALAIAAFLFAHRLRRAPR
jgi:hypothetical protein